MVMLISITSLHSHKPSDEFPIRVFWKFLDMDFDVLDAYCGYNGLKIHES